LFSPLDSPLIDGETYTLKLVAPATSEVMLTTGSERVLIPPSAGKGSAFLGDFVAASPTVEVFIKSAEGRYTGVLSYEVQRR
jgi:hypothetical protein